MAMIMAVIVAMIVSVSMTMVMFLLVKIVHHFLAISWINESRKGTLALLRMFMT